MGKILTVISCLILLTGALSQTRQMPSSYRWENLPPTPALPKPDRSGILAVNGVHLWYAIFGRGLPVILLHGGMANSNYWGFQVPTLARHFRVIVLDSRGHGRSTLDGAPITYPVMAFDVLALMDVLQIRKAALVGWSDGAIVGLYIAIHNPERVTKLFAFGAISNTAGAMDVSRNPIFNAYLSRARKEYQRLSPTPTEFETFSEQVKKMWDDEPHFSDNELHSIKVPTWIVDGDQEEVVKRQDTDRMAKLIPAAGELILPWVSHFALLQDPLQFNRALLHFLSLP